MDLKKKKHNWDRKKRTFAALQDKFFQAREVFPLQIIAGAFETRQKWMVAFPTHLGWNINCSCTTNSTVSVRRVNMRKQFCFHSNQRGHRIPTFKDLWTLTSEWYLRKARMQYWGLLYCHVFLFSLLFDSCWTFKVEEDQNSCIFLFSLWMQIHKRAPKNTKPVQIQQRKPDASCDLTSWAAKWEECLKQTLLLEISISNCWCHPQTQRALLDNRSDPNWPVAVRSLLSTWMHWQSMGSVFYEECLQ